MSFQVFRYACRKTFFNVNRACHNLVSKRNKAFLSEEFACQNAWEAQFSSPLFGRLDMNKYFFEIDRKFGNEGRGSPVDIEIFATAALMDRQKLSEDNLTERFDQLEELLRRFRKTPQTSLTMTATHHAVIRAYTNAGFTDNLMRIISKPVEFGMFLDNYSMVFLLNHFLEKQNFRDASKIAINMMLQEEYDVPLASQMGIYGAFYYTKNLKNQLEPWDPQPPPTVVEPEDDVKIRVPFLENAYFDDHFDLSVREHLLGKTLAKLAEHSIHGNTEEDQIAKKSLQLLGYTMFEKWEKVISMCEELTSFFLSQDCVALALSFAEESSSTDDLKAIALERIKSLKVKEDFNLEKYLEGRIEKIIPECEPEYIHVQTSLIQQYEAERDKELDKQYKLFLRESKLKEIEEIKRQMDEKEEYLFFFENYDKMEKEKFEKFAKWRKTWPRRSWFPQIKMDKVENVDPYRQS